MSLWALSLVCLLVSSFDCGVVGNSNPASKGGPSSTLVHDKVVVILQTRCDVDSHSPVITKILNRDIRFKTGWEITSKRHSFVGMPSDVVVLQVLKKSSNWTASLMAHLQASPKIKSATKERMFRRGLANANVERHDQLYQHNSNNPTSNITSTFNSTSHTNASTANVTGPAPCVERVQTANDGVGDRVGDGVGGSLEDWRRRKLLAWAGDRGVTGPMDADELWNLGYSGEGINVAIFDTGLMHGHPHFKNIIERTVWTDDKSPDDKVGHGTFVAGVVAGTSETCRGFAPNARVHVFKVFNDDEISFSSWFLDAFNYAIHVGVDVLNLSIGGPDYMDIPFVDKVLEVTANGIIMVSAIGNDGPLYGTLNNPADQSNVIGVGGIDYDDRIAPFSSRGMTTWELPAGYGRFKPDVVAYGSDVWAASPSYGCRSLSGTSVSSPVVAGAVTLLASVVPVDQRSRLLNPASMKQALVESATKITTTTTTTPPKSQSTPGIFEQGQGKINMLVAHDILRTYNPRASVLPALFDTTDCPYMWPYCEQPVFYGAVPIIANFTILNGMGVVGEIDGSPTWYPTPNRSGHRLEISFSHSATLWPWTGWICLKISAAPNAVTWDGVAEGVVRFTVRSPSIVNIGEHLSSVVTLPIRIKIVRKPPRHRRLLWDQYHNLGYPSGFFPKDNVRVKADPLDWNGDHPHTNFRKVFTYLRSKGFYVDVLGEPYTCFSATEYAALLIVDPEEEFFAEEIAKFADDVRTHALNVIVIADWYSQPMMNHVRFFDTNTQNWWNAETGGANVPALNELLAGFGVEMMSGVFDGTLRHGHAHGERSKVAPFASGTGIKRFPAGGHVVSAVLHDHEHEVLTGQTLDKDVTVLGLYQVNHSQHSTSRVGGRLAVFGDSNCFDEAHANELRPDDAGVCTWLLEILLDYAVDNVLSPELLRITEKLQSNTDFAHDTNSATRSHNSTLYMYSKVLRGDGGKHTLPSCATTPWASPSILKEAWTQPWDVVAKHPQPEVSKKGGKRPRTTLPPTSEPMEWLLRGVLISAALVLIIMYRLHGARLLRSRVRRRIL